MPQFDIVVFTNEIVWVFFFFILLYSFNYLFFFPKISEILKVRTKKVSLDLVTLEKLDVKLISILKSKENYFFDNLLILSFKDYLNFNANIGFLNKINVLGYNLYVKYYLNSFYKHFDFYELEQF